MMLQAKYWLPLIFSVAVLIISCKKEEEEEPIPCPNCQLDDSYEGLKDWMFYDVGSYWVYEEENTGNIDTVFVNGTNEGVTNDGWEAFTIETFSTWEEFYVYYGYNDSWSVECNLDECCNCKRIFRTKSRPNEFVGEDLAFQFPPILNNFNALLGGGASTMVEIDSTYSNGSIDFGLTAIFELTEPNTENEQLTFFYISKNIGITRKILTEDEEDWELIEYNIVQ